MGIRVSPGGYLALAALLTFVSAILLREHRDFAAVLLVISTWIVTLIAVATDRLYFDGRILFRSGFMPMLARVLHGRSSRLAIDNVEQVEVAAVRTLRRGGSI